uniref:Uncharacterized protein n=1 Tax=Octopus bimaculoides TaxID=37653 RepID=A0A0L8GG09_OCTBM
MYRTIHNRQLFGVMLLTTVLLKNDLLFLMMLEQIVQQMLYLYMFVNALKHASVKIN